jgi:hypothetical protein
VAKTGHPNFVYDMSSPWRTGMHTWSLTGNHSGSSFDATDAQTFMTGTASPFALSFGPFISTTDTTVIRAAYYDGIASTPVWEATYDTDHPAPTPLVPTGAAMSSASPQEPLEACVILEAYAGLSSRTKPVYLRKYIHAIGVDNVAASDTGVVWTYHSGGGAAAAAAAMGNGSWYGTRVYISPTGRQPLSGAWVPVAAVGNHQMPRGRKRKITTGGSLASILGDIETFAAEAAAKAAAEL